MLQGCSQLSIIHIAQSELVCLLLQECSLEGTSNGSGHNEEDAQQMSNGTQVAEPCLPPQNQSYYLAISSDMHHMASG